MAIHAQDRAYRFVLLFFNCLLTFGSYFCFDMPSVLQDTFTGTVHTQKNCTDANSTTNVSICNVTCDDCLGMSDDSYNLLYAIYAWTNAFVVIGAGFLIDKLGNRIGLFLFSFLVVLGSSTFAVGAMLKGTKAMLPVMLLGRLLFGSGNGSMTIVQNRLTAYWFRNKELALAFGITLAFSRLGSVLNFFLTKNFEGTYGLNWTLWGGAMLCGLGFVSAIIVSFLDIYGVKQLGDADNLRTESKKVRVTDVRYFSVSYWLLALTIMFFYNGVFPFVADSRKILLKEYGFRGPDVPDVIGMRGYLAIGCAVFTIPVFGLLAFTHVYPLVPTLWLGVTYSIAAASMWPSIPLVVSQATIGTAMGLTTSIQMIGIGISNLVVGQILGKNQGLSDELTLERWKYVMIFLLANTLACVLTSLFLNINDKRKGGILNLSRKDKLRAESLIGSVSESGKSSDTSDDENEPLLRNRKRIN
ncbi:major facilitator superfamily domain-containing protein 1-like [Ruditapes philippinarum]|uniref:major facilitator superfamily domain-containing protein 1-like n=1 Tax=Ruditapes philippinarum TaxID=129788 RepID=UPI00295BE445|nr:major facilitator superfamily domain-containing protein 1-like [Ruditapes philippinarum]